MALSNIITAITNTILLTFGGIITITLAYYAYNIYLMRKKLKLLNNIEERITTIEHNINDIRKTLHQR